MNANAKQRLQKIIATVVRYAKLLIRLALITSAVVLCISIIVNFTFDDREIAGEAVAYSVGWCAAMFAVVTVLYGTPTLLVIAIYFKLLQIPVWTSLKKELFLMLLTLILIGMFMLSQYYWISIYMNTGL